MGVGERPTSQNRSLDSRMSNANDELVEMLEKILITSHVTDYAKNTCPCCLRVKAVLVAHKANQTPEQPPIGGFCDSCGHFAARHNEQGCHFPYEEGAVVCDCPVMVWQEIEWPRPWHPAPRGLVVTDE